MATSILHKISLAKNQLDGFWSVRSGNSSDGIGKSLYFFRLTFRAENSNTTRHLAEFWMVEPEVAFNNGRQYRFIENFLKYVIIMF